MDTLAPKKRTPISKFLPFLIILIVIKITLSGLFTSDYQKKMFMPFIQNFLNSLGTQDWNPWQRMYAQNQKIDFPYPPLMLFIESSGGLVLHAFPKMPSFLQNVVFKLPSLCFDILGLYWLLLMFPNERKYAGLLYFASPIIIYATYIHGQLDIIPTVLLLGCLYELTKKTRKGIILPAILYSCALLCKLHIVALLPLMLMFLYKRDGVMQSLRFCLITILFACAVMTPFASEGFLHGVLFNDEQSILTKVFMPFADLKIYIPILVVVLMYYVILNLNMINRDLLLSLSGLLFTVFLTFCAPMPGWYVWVVPFITVFFMNIQESKKASITSFILLNALYLSYFIFFHYRPNIVDMYFCATDLSFLKLNNAILANIFFTILTGSLLYTSFTMYKMGVSSNAMYKRRNRPFTIGIAGDSSSGKTTMIQIIERMLGVSNIIFIEGDGDHRWERGSQEWNEYTHLNPKANYLYRQAQDIQKLKSGQSVHRVEYNHSTGEFTEMQILHPNKYVILSGLHSLYLPQMRKILDLKIFIDADEKLRRFWKIRRDMSERDYTKERIIKQIKTRIPDAEKYIIPQKNYADLVIRYFDETLTDDILTPHNVMLNVQLTFSATVDAEPLIMNLTKYGIRVSYDYSMDLMKQTLSVYSPDHEVDISKIPFSNIADSIIPHLEEITVQELKGKALVDWVITIVILLLISSRMRGDI